MIEKPDNWVLLSLPNDEYKVFATWAGGYLDGDSWRLNSGIKSVELEDDYYYFYGYSGSCYMCHKDSYGVATSFGQTVLEDILEKLEGKVKLVENFKKIINEKYKS